MAQNSALESVRNRLRESGDPGTAVSLDLDCIPIRQFTKEMKAELEQYKEIQNLTMNLCSLRSLQNFPIFPNLLYLELSDNNIQDDQLYHLCKNSHISHIMLDSNKLRSIQKVTILRQLPNLQQLEIQSNYFGDSDFYRDELFDNIPQLKIIDCHNRDGEIAINSDSEDEESPQENKRRRPEASSQSDSSQEIFQTVGRKRVKCLEEKAQMNILEALNKCQTEDLISQEQSHQYGSA